MTRRNGRGRRTFLRLPVLVAALLLRSEPTRASEPLPALRARLDRAAEAARAGDAAAARRALDGAETERLALKDLSAWLPLAAEAALPADAQVVERLGAFAAAAHEESFAREALLAAARLATTPAARTYVLAALARVPEGPALRRRIAFGVARMRLAATREDARRFAVALAATVPDAPERAPGLFEEPERKLFLEGVRQAPPETRLARARAIASKHGDDAVALLRTLPDAAPIALDVAETYLLAARPREARAILLGRPVATGDAADVSLRRDALVLSADLRMPDGAVAKSARRGRRHGAGIVRGNPFAEGAAGSSPPSTEALEKRLEGLLAQPLAPSDRRRLLVDAVRFEVRFGRMTETKRRAADLVRVDAGATTGAEELFVDAFARFRTARSLPGETERRAASVEAARRFGDLAALYRDVPVRRRATYWAARAHEQARESESSRELFASLLSGSSSDLWARFSAAALGVPLPVRAAPAADGAEIADADETSEAPDAPERELFALGLVDLAEDVAARAGAIDPLFAAALASARGEHRHAAWLLKGRFPEIGTPEEGGVPLEARRAYYPVDHAELIRRIAAESQVPAALLFGVIRQESLFETRALSRVGAQGLMQVMPATGRLLVRREGKRGRPDLNDPAENVRLGARYLGDMLRLFGGDTALALAAYNAGPGRVLRWRRERPGLPADEFIETIPLTEPRDYVHRVLFFEGAYAALYGAPDESRTAGMPAPQSPPAF